MGFGEKERNPGTCEDPDVCRVDIAQGTSATITALIDPLATSV